MDEIEYIEREAALAFPFANGRYDHEHANEHFIFGCESYKEWLEQLPAADVVPVVRCKDCTHSFMRGGNMMCEKHRYTWNNCERWVNDDDFCCWGVRKDGDGDV